MTHQPSREFERVCANTFTDMEGTINNIYQMAKIETQIVFDAVGNLKCREGEPIEIPTGEHVVAALFASGHLLEMIEALRKSYYASFKKAQEAING
jgi:hypothetical protein